MIKSQRKGFTLVEVVITIAIVTILSTTAIVNYYSFNDRLSLSSAGQEMAINIRQAQTYGINVKENTPGGGVFNTPYGIYFDMDSVSNDNYVIFSDANNNKKYDENSGCGSGSTECVEKITLKGGVTISFVDATDACPAINAARSLTIRFIRPNPDADISFIKKNTGTVNCHSLSDAIITLTSRGGRTLLLSVGATGQIHVQ